MLQKFILLYGTGGNPACAFIEGTDDKEFFQYALEGRAKGNVEFILCDGKAGVLNALREIRSRYPNASRTMFFIDKDFDDYLSERLEVSAWLYTTRFYSVENHLVGEEALHVVLCKIGHFPPDHTRVRELCRRYSEIVRRFCIILRRYTACAIACKRKKIAVNFGNVQLRRLFRINAQFELVADPSLGLKLRNMAGVPEGALCSGDLKREIRMLRLADFKSWLRGKFELWLFVKFVERVYKELKGTSIGDGILFAPPIALTERNAFQLLAGRVSYPEELVSFLDRVLD